MEPINRQRREALKKRDSDKQVMIFVFSLLIERGLYRIASLLLQVYQKRERLIRTNAYKLWEEEFGAMSDYYKSKAKLHNCYNCFLHPFITTYKLLKKTPAFLKSRELSAIVGIIQTLAIVIGLITFIATEKQRRNAEVYQAWQVITAAYDQPGSGARKEALEFLNSQPRKIPFIWQKWKKQSLAGLDASKAYFHKIVLKGTDLRYANLEETDLRYAEFQKANLTKANLINAKLFHADLEEADLKSANLFLADLRGANLTDAYLTEADLRNANLFLADLRGADLTEADLRGADLRGADLRGADLTDTDLRGADLTYTILMNAIGLKPKQIKSAFFWEQVIYVGKWNPKEKLIEPIEPDNKKCIEDLRNDASSDNENSENCPFRNTQ